MPIHHLRRILPPSWRRRLRFVPRRLPPHWLYLWNDRRLEWFTGVAPEMRDRACLVTWELQPGCSLEAYWVDRTGAAGTRDLGPAAFLVVHGSEILKFDCYGSPVGHYHVATPHPHGIRRGLAGRIWLPETSIEQQIDRAVFELCRNANYYLRTHPRRRIRSTVLDEQRLAAACAEMRAKMLDDVRKLLDVGGKPARDPRSAPGKGWAAHGS